jgi:hypothetical protein
MTEEIYKKGQELKRKIDSAKFKISFLQTAKKTIDDLYDLNTQGSIPFADVSANRFDDVMRILVKHMGKKAFLDKIEDMIDEQVMYLDIYESDFAKL